MNKANEIRLKQLADMVNDKCKENMNKHSTLGIDPLKKINERGKLLADLTSGKEFDTPTSLFLRGENEALKQRVKQLEEALQPFVKLADSVLKDTLKTNESPLYGYNDAVLYVRDLSAAKEALNTIK